MYEHNFITQVAELEMTVVLAEVIYRLLSEKGFHEQKAVTQMDLRDVFTHNEAHWALKRGWELIEIGARFEEKIYDGAQLFFVKYVNRRHSEKLFPAIY